MDETMLGPIQLTEHGETLLPYPGKENDYEDQHELHCCIGVHDVCEGWIDIREVSGSHSAIVCRQCGLRVVVPSSSSATWADLREHLEGLR